MKRIALIGAAEGPWTAIKWVKEPVLRVSGLLEGSITVSLMSAKSSVPLLHFIDTNGETKLTELAATFATDLEWVRLTASHPTKSLICVVLPAKAA